MSPLWAEHRHFGAAGVPAGVAVTVLRRQPLARPGSGVTTLGPWKDAKEHEVSGVGLDRTLSSTIVGDHGDSEQQTATLFGPAEADIQRGDRVTFPDGVIVEVSGIPDRSASMFTGWRPPMSVQVKVTHG